MSFRATVWKVVIASPGDVPQERKIIREVIHEWNAVHAADRSLVLLPVGWDTHSSPSMRNNAQDVINDQILNDCDLLIAVFWTRIGTATKDFAGGAVEEIEKHIASDKPAMIYFSNAPVQPDSVDLSQYTALVEFRQSLMKRGLIERFDSTPDFADLLKRQLAQTVIREFNAIEDFAYDDREDDKSAEELTKEAGVLLYAAAIVGDGSIMMLDTLSGTIVQAHGHNFCTSTDNETTMKWREAVKQLESLGLINDDGHKGEVFSVTSKGYVRAREQQAD